MIGAIKMENGKYAIMDIHPKNKYSNTYSYREKLKSFGGNWNAKNRRWENIDGKYLKDLKANKRFKVRIKPFSASEKSQNIFVFEHEIKGNKVQMLNHADDREWVEIEEIYGEY